MNMEQQSSSSTQVPKAQRHLEQDQENFKVGEVPTEPEIAPKPWHHKRREVIIGESTDSNKLNSPPAAPKTLQERAYLWQSLKKNPLFSHLEPDERNEVFDAMREACFSAGQIIIKQGDTGDDFYVVKDGTCDVYVNDPPKHVMTIEPGGSFGELALIYGKPRAATVKARTNVHCWAVDRNTYKRVLMDTTLRKRLLYKQFLERVPLLQSMTEYERLTVADAVETVEYNDGETIIRQGDPGDAFYILVEGEVICRREMPKVEQVVNKLHPADYFGEIALLTAQPRAASVVANGPVKCIKLDRERFNRVLGPCEDILRRNMEAYNKYMPMALAE
jgi:cAMP-dependent protein kinase regulator